MTPAPPAPPGPAPARSEPAPRSVAEAATRLASLLLGVPSPTVGDPRERDLVFEPAPGPRPLARGQAPVETWAVDGGQGLVADARCLQVVVTRAARVCFAGGRCRREDEGELRAWLLGAGFEREAVARLGLGVDPGAGVDVNLLRDAGEWEAVAACVEEAAPGSLVLLDGDLRADLRIPAATVAAVLARAEARGVAVAAVTKHSSLSRGGVPLVGHLEVTATALLGPRSRWWAPVARAAPALGYDVTVAVARLDPDAHFAFRVDVGPGADVEAVLGALAATCDDAAFCGYPYPLAVADRLAACPGWLRHDVWLEVEERLDAAGVEPGVRERAFADRHGLLERA